MTVADLKSACSTWDESSESFARIVAAALASLGVYQRDLANEFQVAESTVSRWAHGVARPHPRLQKLILMTIQRRARRSTRATHTKQATSTRVRTATQRVAVKSH